MIKQKNLALALSLAALSAGNAAGQTDDFAFFQREARTVVSASFLPQSVKESPATVHVVTAEDIRASGAQTLWDALRAVPGVDVTAFRTSHADVSVRGMNKQLNYRTLILLDGKTVLNAFLDFTDWESIPVTLEEIDRIEVVAGPLSALYGANALHGTINIITKTPEQLNGGQIQYTAGEGFTHRPSAVFGEKRGKWSYKGSAAWRSTNRFESAASDASDVAKGSAFLGYDIAKDARVSLSGGLADHAVQLPDNRSTDDGRLGFLRADAVWGGTQLRAFWNRGYAHWQNHPLDFSFDHDTYDVTLQHVLKPLANHRLVAGAGYRRNTSGSNVFSPGIRQHDLGSFFFEDTWRVAPRWTLVADGRFDYHPLTDLVFSPRGSVLFSPARAHTIRASVGSAFRNPTLLENYFDSTFRTPNAGSAALPNPPISAVETAVVPNSKLNPERMVYHELVHRGDFRRVKTFAALFQYRLSDIISGETRTSVAPPVLRQELLIVNRGVTTNWGGEAGAEWMALPTLDLFANYAYQQVRDESSVETAEDTSPRNKVNAGARWKHRGVTANLWAHWVDRTAWTNSGGHAVVDDYTLVNARVAYAFARRLKGLEAGVNVFNLFNDKHDEAAPNPPHNGEIIRARWTASLSYVFGRAGGRGDE